MSAVPAGGAAPQLSETAKGFLSSATSVLSSGYAKLTAPTTNFSILVTIGIIVLTLGIMVYYFKAISLLETPGNMRRISKDIMVANAAYDTNNPSRIGLRAYAQALINSGTPETHLALTNFYVSTVNATGVFYPALDGVVSPEAARMAVRAGARGFVFDLYPDLSPNAHFSPVVQVVESGSLWRRITLNEQPFAAILKVLIQEAFEISERPGSEDPVFIYLRFRGKPRTSTFQSTANALRVVLDKYRLDASYNGCRRQQTIFTIPITSLFKKVIIVSNIRADNTVLNDYINIGPADGIALEYLTNTVKGFTEADKIYAMTKIKTNLTWIAPLSEDPLAEANSYDVPANQAVGIHFCAMNFWNNNDKLKAYMADTMFGKRSFLIKPEPMRYIVDIIPKAPVPEDPKWGSGTSAGKMSDPTAIRNPF